MLLCLVGVTGAVPESFWSTREGLVNKQALYEQLCVDERMVREDTDGYTLK